jgi:hypothetical protein
VTRSLQPARFWQAAVNRPGLIFLPLGAAVGPRGLNLLPDSLIPYLDPAVAAALAVIGALAGLSVAAAAPKVGRWGLTAIESVSTTIVVAAGIAIAVAAGVSVDAPMWQVALLLGICASASASAPDIAVATGIGAVVLAWFLRGAMIAAVGLIAAAAIVAILIAIAGWLLAGQSPDKDEQRVFAAGTVLLLGGTAEYIAVSALFAGLMAGVCWGVWRGEARDRLARDLDSFQHPLLVILLLIAGARCHVSLEAATLVLVYVVCRTASKLAGARLDRSIEPRPPSNGIGLSRLVPGAFAVAFAITATAVWGPQAAIVLDVAVVGSFIAGLQSIAAPAPEAA